MSDDSAPPPLKLVKSIEPAVAADPAEPILELTEQSPEEIKTSELIEEIFDYWREKMGYLRARLDVKRKRLIRTRLLDGYSVEDLKIAILGCRHSPFHQGDNDRSARYDDLTLIMRDASYVDKFCCIGDRVLAKAEATLISEKKVATPEVVGNRCIPDKIKEQFGLIKKQSQSRLLTKVETTQIIAGVG